MEKKNKKPIRLIIVTVILLLMVTCSLVYAYFGGFSTGKSADIGEFAKYAETITGDELPEIDVPESTRMIMLPMKTEIGSFLTRQITYTKTLTEINGVISLIQKCFMSF